MASRSNSAVNCEPGSAHGTRSCLTPCVPHSTRGTSASIQVVNCIVSRWRQRRGLLSYRPVGVPHSGHGYGPGPASTRTTTRCPFMSTSTPATVHGAVNPSSARYSSTSRMAPILLDRSIAGGPLYPHDSRKSQVRKHASCLESAPIRAVSYFAG